MLCDVCREGLEGIWDPDNRKRLGLLKDFPELLECCFPDVEDGNYDQELSELELRGVEQYIFGHHVNYDSLVRSQELGCVVCTVFDQFHDGDDVNPALADLGYYSVFQVTLPRSNRPRPEMVVLSGETLEAFRHEMIPHDENDSVNSAISQSTSEQQTWALVQAWVDKCLNSHELCRRQAAELFSPTRLLELQHVGGEKIFRLVLRDEFDPRDRYITLSHCWGPEPAEKKLRLLKNKQEVLRNGLPVAILPRTFRDAFEVVERLGIRYLWIDRLCIIQDSKEDWQAEASIMGPVYTHGLLNIAALGASDDQSGCFFSRDPTLVSPTIVDLTSHGDNIAAFYRFEAEEESWRKDFEGEPLISRAWVLQERILSTRNLYFGSKQVFWECLEIHCCETIPNTWVGGSDARGRSLFVPGSKRYPWKSLIDPKGKGSIIPITSWQNAVETYSKCNLTLPSDKLVALSGLAKRMGNAMKSDGLGDNTYLAGIWKHTMPETLLWIPKTSCRRVPSYRAPSWSWASVDGIVSFRRAECRRWHVELLEAETTPGRDDVTGELTSGFLTLRGHTCAARNLKQLKTLPGERSTYKIGSLHHPETGVKLNFGDRSAKLELDTLDEVHSAVIILIFGFRPCKPFSNVRIQGLALVPTDGYHQLSYRRVGCVFLEQTVDFDDSDFEKDLYSELPLEVITII
ncbi:HET-domain-containing protein [Daldinia bambusicola]|nr:HET-domain-containing protein [Daldinia bambusicola]